MDPDTLTYDEWDALLIEEWFQADPGAPLPVSSREGEFEWAHQNQAAWALVDEPELNGLSKVEALRRMVAQVTTTGERKFNPSQPRGPHTGEWVKGTINIGSDVIDKLTKPLAHGDGWKMTINTDAVRVFAKDSNTFRVEDSTITEQQLKPLFRLADRLTVDNPLPGGKPLEATIITRKKMNTLMPPKPGQRTDGFNFVGAGQITMASDTFTRGVVNTHGFHPPIADTVPTAVFIFAHEWGHGIDTRRKSTLDSYAAERPAKGSEYGAANERERFAESFAEFYLSGGKTALLTPRMDAEEYGWKAMT